VWRAGQRVGEYELTARLRDGGMATLYLARQPGDAPPVALKVIQPELADDAQCRQMFLDEARLATRIRHPNVVRVDASGEHSGTPYLVMELVHGCSLAQLLRALAARGRRLTPACAVSVAMRVAEGLHAAHETRDEQGRRLEVVHRDVTPENILLAYSGEVKLIDFGIAKASGRRHHTQDGLLKGKFRYLSPEQATARALDRRADIYQLGIVLWEMLTLRRLFSEDDDGALLRAVQNPRIAAPSRYAAAISPELDATVMSALARHPGDRPPDARTFAHALSIAVPEAAAISLKELRGVLLAAMHEQREHERATLPEGVFDALDRAALPGVTMRREHPSGAMLLRHTLAHERMHDELAPVRTVRARVRSVARWSLSLGRTSGERLLRLAPTLSPRARVPLGVREQSPAAPVASPMRRAGWMAVGALVGLCAAVLLILFIMPAKRRAPAALPAVPASVFRAGAQQLLPTGAASELPTVASPKAPGHGESAPAGSQRTSQRR
jgi:hypothetical protein